MGSFNDVCIDPINGHPVVDDDVDSVNRALADMRSAMHDDATALLQIDRRPQRVCLLPPTHALAT
jgi:hypothetical protein